MLQMFSFFLKEQNSFNCSESGLQFELLFLIWHDKFFSCSCIGMTMMNDNPKTG